MPRPGITASRSALDNEARRFEVEGVASGSRAALGYISIRAGRNRIQSATVMICTVFKVLTVV